MKTTALKRLKEIRFYPEKMSVLLFRTEFNNAMRNAEVDDETPLAVEMLKNALPQTHKHSLNLLVLAFAQSNALAPTNVP